jgi:hypothetical protein
MANVDEYVSGKILEDAERMLEATEDRKSVEWEIRQVVVTNTKKLYSIGNRIAVFV